MSVVCRSRFSPLFYVGIVWLTLGIANPKQVAFTGIGVVFLALGIRRGPAASEQDTPDTPPRESPADQDC